MRIVNITNFFNTSVSHLVWLQWQPASFRLSCTWLSFEFNFYKNKIKSDLKKWKKKSKYFVFLSKIPALRQRVLSRSFDKKRFAAINKRSILSPKKKQQQQQQQQQTTNEHTLSLPIVDFSTTLMKKSGTRSRLTLRASVMIGIWNDHLAWPLAHCSNGVVHESRAFVTSMHSFSLRHKTKN